MKRITLLIPLFLLYLLVGSCKKEDDRYTVNYDSDLMNPTVTELMAFYEGGYNTVSGDIVLDSVEDIENLWYLSNLVTVNGDLLIRGNKSLQTLDGLHRLRDVGGDFILSDCPSLPAVNYTGFVRSVTGSLRIENNASLVRIELPSLMNVEGDLVLTGNKILESEIDFTGLTRVGGNFIVSNSRLKDLLGFSSIREIEYDLILDNNKLRNLDGLESLDRVGTRLSVTDNPYLSDLCGIRHMLLETGSKIDVVIKGNGYNPSVQAILDGGCSQ